MKYLVVNPYGPAYGIAAYSHLITRLLTDRVDTDYIGNDDGISWGDFRTRVADYVVRNYKPDEVVLEAPEARAATLLVPRDYRIHVRLHSPGAIGELGNAWALDPDRLDSELAVIESATVLSTSAHAILTLMTGLMDTSPTHVFKNPTDRAIAFGGADRKDLDVFFMGRLERLKGADVLSGLLERLPPSYRASMVGPGFEAFQAPPEARCHIESGPAIYDRSRFDLLARSRVFLMLSRFENCSLAILEALAAGTVVVGWDVGGNSEIAPPPLMRLVPFGDVDALTDTVRDVVEGDYPFPVEFKEAADALTSDFDAGWSAVWREFRGIASTKPYLGLDCRPAHVKADPSLVGGPRLLPVEDAYAKARSTPAS